MTVTIISVRAKNREKYIECIKLRKQGLSYREIRQIVPIGKTTLNNWLTLAGLTLTAEHLNIQSLKRVENFRAGVEASRITRTIKRELEINRSIQKQKLFFNDSLFITGIMLYEAEGSKDPTHQASFSNSDFKLIKVFIKFIEKYFNIDRNIDMSFKVAIHITRSDDKEKITNFWAKKLNIQKDNIKISWKKNIVTRRRSNPDYVGQMIVRLSGVPYFTRKLLAYSDIILKQQLNN